MRLAGNQLRVQEVAAPGQEANWLLVLASYINQASVFPWFVKDLHACNWRGGVSSLILHSFGLGGSQSGVGAAPKSYNERENPASPRTTGLCCVARTRYCTLAQETFFS